ncbi:MAG TPA: FixH family protein [Phnomibacter sp.]|nr:FixH family protein [Phnomibacter sp.]
MTIKWHWGTKIFLVYGLFVVFMLGMVYLCTQQHYDLVTPDYYAQELKYQEVIDGQNNLQALGKKVEINATENLVTVQLPMNVSDGKAEVRFYRPDNASLDFNMTIKDGNSIMVPAAKFKTGVYKVKSIWMHEGKRYYDEQTYFAP